MSIPLYLKYFNRVMGVVEPYIHSFNPFFNVEKDESGESFLVVVFNLPDEEDVIIRKYVEFLDTVLETKIYSEGISSRDVFVEQTDRAISINFRLMW